MGVREGPGRSGPAAPRVLRWPATGQERRRYNREVSLGGTAKQGRPRQDWPVNVYRLGDEPADDQSQLSTPEERLAVMWELTVAAWSLTGRSIPAYERRETPISVRPRVDEAQGP